MGSFEYYHTSFSYTDQDPGRKFVGVPEQGGRDLSLPDPSPPGQSMRPGRHRRRHRRSLPPGGLGVRAAPANSSSPTAGGWGRRKSRSTGPSAFSSATRRNGVARELDSPTFTSKSSTYSQPRRGELGMAFFVAAYSALKSPRLAPALLMTGDLSVQGNIKPCDPSSSPCRSRWTMAPGAR